MGGFCGGRGAVRPVEDSFAGAPPSIARWGSAGSGSFFAGISGVLAGAPVAAAGRTGVSPGRAIARPVVSPGGTPGFAGMREGTAGRPATGAPAAAAGRTTRGVPAGRTEGTAPGVVAGATGRAGTPGARGSPASTIAGPAGRAGLATGRKASGTAGGSAATGTDGGAATAGNAATGTAAGAFGASGCSPSAAARIYLRTFSAVSRSSELECVFFSVKPTWGKDSRIALALTSSSRASSLMRIWLDSAISGAATRAPSYP
jgi:pilus assembly protein FimV